MAEQSAYNYEPEPPPENADAKVLMAWALQELRKASIVINNLAAGHCDTLNVAPTKPRTGMVRYADGTNWNPGSGKGYYGYDATIAAWRFLG